MGERNMRSPDERWDTVNKDSTKDTTYSERNKQKPDDVRVKDEITSRDEDDEDDG